MGHHALVRTEWVSGTGIATWLASTVYPVNALIVPSPKNGFYYKQTTGAPASSGPTQPVWPTTHGATVVDGAITWTCMYATSVLSSELAQFDTNISGSMNGVDGGCGAPSAFAIAINGAGLKITGPLTVARGGMLYMLTGRANFDPGQFPQLGPGHSGRTRNFVYSFLRARPVPFAMWRVHRATSSMQSFAPSYTDWTTPGVGLANLHFIGVAGNGLQTSVGTKTPGLSLGLRGVHGATIGQITINFRVSTPHDSLPATMPSARLLRVDQNGNGIPCSSVASGADSDGWVYAAKPASASGWYNQGNPQSFVLPCDQNNVVDRTKYNYRLEVREEQGLTGYPWVLRVMQPCLAAYDGAAWPLSPSTVGGTVDGVALPAGGGARILVLNALTGVNGIYVTTPTSGNQPWLYAGDLSSSSQFSAGFVVGVQQGQKYAGTYFQASSTVSAWAGDFPPPGTGVWRTSTPYPVNVPILPLTPNGFWYICAVAGTSANPDEPPWPKSTGATVTDNSVTWRCMGAYPQLPFVTRPDADTWPEGYAMQAHGNIFHTAVVEYTNVLVNGFQ